MKTLQDIYNAIPVVPLMTYTGLKAVVIDSINEMQSISLIDAEKNSHFVSREYKTLTGENYFEFRYRHLKNFLNRYIFCRWKNEFYLIFIDDNLVVWALNTSEDNNEFFAISMSIDTVDFNDIYLIDAD